MSIMRNDRKKAIAAIISTFGGLGVGASLSWTVTAIPSLEKSGELGELSYFDKSLIGGLLPAGALVSCILSGFLVDKLGRKKFLQWLALLELVGWIMIFLAISKYFVFIGRLMTGITMGGYSVTIPIYVKEISPPGCRGKIGSLFLGTLYIGRLITNLLGMYFSPFALAFISSLFTTLYGLTLFVVLESPAYLPNAALKNNKLLKDSKSTKAIGMTEDIVKPALIVFLLMFLAEATGITVVTMYTVEVFEMVGRTHLEPMVSTVILSLVQLVGCLPTTLVVDRCGRKVLVTTSLFAMTISLGIVAGYFYVKKEAPQILEEYPQLGVLPLVAFVVVMLAYSWGIGNVCFIIVAEIVPQEVVGKVSAIALVIYWGTAFTSVWAFQAFKNYILVYTWFSIFGGISLFGFVFTCLFLPETKNKIQNEVSAL